MYIILVDSKGAKLSGAPENVAINDVHIIAILKQVAASKRAYELVFSASYSEVLAFLREAACFFGLPPEHATSHSMRRGGATWYFEAYGFDRTAAHGRWRQVQTCRTYINRAQADLAEICLEESDRDRISRAVAAYPAAIARLRLGASGG